jgi:hypothetical protein
MNLAGILGAPHSLMPCQDDTSMPFKREKRKRETQKIMKEERNKYFSEIISFLSIFIFGEVQRVEFFKDQEREGRRRRNENDEWGFGFNEDVDFDSQTWFTLPSLSNVGEAFSVDLICIPPILSILNCDASQ